MEAQLAPELPSVLGRTPCPSSGTMKFILCPDILIPQGCHGSLTEMVFTFQGISTLHPVGKKTS